MARPASSGIHDQSATLRQLKLLVMVLVLSNIGLGVFSFYLLRKIDHSYSDLIDRSIPVLNDLQTVTAKAVRAMRGTNTMTAVAAGVNDATLVKHARAAFDDEENVRLALLKANWLTPENVARKDFEVAGANFARIGGEVVAKLEAKDLTAATRMRDESLRPAFESYLVAVTKAADVIEAESLRINDRVSATAGNMSNVVLGLASWPVVLLAGLLLLTAIFVVVLMVLFRGREMSDTP